MSPKAKTEGVVLINDDLVEEEEEKDEVEEIKTIAANGKGRVGKRYARAKREEDERSPLNSKGDHKEFGAHVSAGAGNCI